jgi:hypothetical protein
MESRAFTLEEDLYALSSLAPTAKVEQRIAKLLQLIETSSSLAQRDKPMGLITGYIHALEDLGALDEEQQTLLRELVTRASLRSHVGTT